MIGSKVCRNMRVDIIYVSEHTCIYYYVGVGMCMDENTSSLALYSNTDIDTAKFGRVHISFSLLLRN